MCGTNHTPFELEQLLVAAGLEGRKHLTVTDLVALARVAEARGGELGLDRLFDQLGLLPDDPPMNIRRHPIVL